VFLFCFLHLVYPMLPVSLDCPFWLPLRYSLRFIMSCIFRRTQVQQYLRDIENYGSTWSTSRLTLTLLVEMASDQASILQRLHCAYSFFLKYMKELLHKKERSQNMLPTMSQHQTVRIVFWQPLSRRHPTIMSDAVRGEPSQPIPGVLYSCFLW
jgi:hypothetical protein